MKKFITLLLVLTGMVTTVSATKNIYLSPSSEWKQDNAIFVAGCWGTGSTTFYKFSIAPYETSVYSISIPDGVTGIKIVRKDPNTATWNDWDTGKWNETGDIDTPYDGELITVAGWGTTSTSDYQAPINSVSLSYGITGKSGWKNLELVEKSAGVYSATLDLSNTLKNRNFQLLINDEWLGTSELTLEDDESLVTLGVSAGDDFTLKNSNGDYKTYTITATWVANQYATSNWTLTVESKAARTNDDYTVTFLKGRTWETINAYAYSGSGEDADKIAVWPGAAMTDTKTTAEAEKNGRYYEVYSYSFKSKFKPETIIFNDGTNETAHLEFENNKLYDYLVPGDVYAAVGGDQTGAGDASHKSIFSGYWDSEGTTDFMDLSADGTTYTFVKKDVIMDPAMTIYTKAISKARADATTGITWRPSGTDNETKITVPVKGIYDITITCDNGGTTVTGTATKTAEAVTVSNADWATTVTNSALDFSGVAEIEAYTATVDAETVTLHKVDDVQAETGLVIMSKDDLAATETFYVPVKAGGSETAKGDLLFSSTATYTTYHTGEAGAEYNRFYGLAVVDGKPRFAQIDCKADDEKTIPAGKAFLKVNTGALVSAQELNVVFEDDSTTGINTVKTAQQNNDNAIYNLAGQRVVAPVKGLYIMNGKKVIMK